MGYTTTTDSDSMPDGRRNVMTENEKLVQNLMNAVRASMNTEYKGERAPEKDSEVEACRQKVLAAMPQKTEAVPPAQFKSGALGPEKSQELAKSDEMQAVLSFVDETVCPNCDHIMARCGIIQRCRNCGYIKVG